MRQFCRFLLLLCGRHPVHLPALHDLLRGCARVARTLGAARASLRHRTRLRDASGLAKIAVALHAPFRIRYLFGFRVSPLVPTFLFLHLRICVDALEHAYACNACILRIRGVCSVRHATAHRGLQGQRCIIREQNALTLAYACNTQLSNPFRS